MDIFQNQPPKMEPIAIDVIINPRTMNQKWAVYIHSIFIKIADPLGGEDIEKPQAIYIGACRTRDLWTTPDARLNSEWRKYAGPQKRLRLEVLALFENDTDAHNYRFTLVKQFQPHCNVHGTNDSGRAKRVKCNETGEEFESGMQAAHHYGIAAPNMSNHLNGRPGYNTLKGLTFRRL